MKKICTLISYISVSADSTLLKTINYSAVNHSKIISAINKYRSRIARSDLNINENSHFAELDPFSSDYFRIGQVNGETFNLEFHDINNLPTSSNMNELVYSEHLSKLAVKETEKCPEELSPGINRRSLRYITSYRNFIMFDESHPKWDPEEAILTFFDDYRRSIRKPFSLKNKEWVQNGQILSFAGAKKIGCATSGCSFESANNPPEKRFIFICLIDQGKFLSKFD